MAGRGRGKFPFNSSQQKNTTLQRYVIEDPINIYLKMSKNFPVSPNSESIQWVTCLSVYLFYNTKNSCFMYF